MAIFSKETENDLNEMIDKRLELMRLMPTMESHRNMCLKIERNVKDINDRLVEVEDIRDSFENDIHDLKNNISEGIKGEDLEDLVGQTMLKLMPNFNDKIAKEIKKHLVTIAEFVIRNFKEKE